jgi:DNA-binding response OmpR family regulator
VAEVLIVDDDPDIRGMLAVTLDDYGFTVREAADGAQALDELAGRPPDVMILDLMMPYMDGFSVLQTMRSTGLAAGTRVVILTCKTDEAALVRGWELGADEYLTKPMDPALLAGRVASLLEADPGAAR